MTSVRVLAAQVLVAVESGRATLGAEVDRARQGLPDERDRGLLLELTSGVCRWRAELDACLAPLSQRALAEMDPSILATLRLAVYQLRHLDRIPAHAVVHQSVEAVRTLGAHRAAGFVNGILRAYLRAGDTLQLPSRPESGATRRQQLAYLSTTLAHPKWLVARWLDRYGFETTEAWCQYNNAAPDVTVRARGGDMDAIALLASAGVTATRGRHAPETARLAPGGLSALDPAVRNALVIQDEGSVVLAHTVGAEPGERVLDLCAAPGGKSAIIWTDMQQDGCLISADVRPRRVAVLADTLLASGMPRRIVQMDATCALPFTDGFDRVFVDAPCSGLGTLRRDPDVKWSVKLESLPALAETQRRILTEAARVVRPGGTLVYATCSSEPEENDAIVDAFRSSAPHFTEVPLAGPLVDPLGRLRTTPVHDGLDAFFAAKLVRREPA